MKVWIQLMTLLVGLVGTSVATGCDQERLEGPTRQSDPVFTSSERKEVQATIEPSLTEIEMELERLSDAMDSNGKAVFAESQRRDLAQLRSRVGRLRVMMEARRTSESEAYRRMRRETTDRLKRYIDRIEELEAKVGREPKAKPADDEPDAGQGA